MKNVIYYGNELFHHGIKDQKWGVRNGPPYPIKRELNGYKLKGPYRIIRSSKISTDKIRAPYEITDYINTKTKKKVRVFYDENGVKFKEIHTSNHSERNKYDGDGFHVHEYTWNEDLSSNTRTARPLNKEEKERNKDLYDKR